MATVPFDVDEPRLPPTRGTIGPVTAARQRRTWILYLAAAAIGALPSLLGLSPALTAAGLGLWVPGGGFVAVGGWAALLFPLTLLLFVFACVAWFWAGMVLAPLTVWLGAALLAGTMAGEATWPGASLIVGLSAVAVGGLFARRNAKLARAAVTRGTAREAFLPASLAEVRRMTAKAPDPSTREMTAGQLAALRYLLDRALQPVRSFDGFTIIDQFQPAALRYQINHMGFALAVAQTAYVPNFRGYMGLAQRNLIEKYLEKKVWDYWVLESCWGHLNFTEWDPAAKDNIMLTGWFGAHVGGYMLATGDRRYLEPGSLSFRLNDRTTYAHDFRSIVGSVNRNYETAEFGHFACEPNWIYPICNHYGMLALVTHDALLGTRLVDRHIDNWLDKLDTEFTDAAGSIIGLRSQLTGMPVPFPVGEAGYAFFANAFAPGRARQQWAIARAEIEPLIEESADGPRLRFPGAGLDAGNYKPGHVGALGTYLVAAREFGDQRVAVAAQRGLEADGAPTVDGGVQRFLNGSNISNATAIMGQFMATGDFRRTFTEGPGATALAGPMIETVDYPGVLVARAWSDGSRLEATLYPGAAPGRFAIPLSQLAPNARYAVTGAEEEAIVADTDGTASINVYLASRTELTVCPA